MVQTFVRVDYARVGTAKTSCKKCKYRLFEHLLFVYIYLSVCQSLSVYLSFNIGICLSLFLSIYVSFCLRSCLPYYLLIHLSVWMIVLFCCENIVFSGCLALVILNMGMLEMSYKMIC